MPTGIALALPEGYVALVHPRSGLAHRSGLSIVNAPGTIDAGYRGEIQVCLVNLDPATPIELSRGDRIAQLVIQRFETAEFVEVDDTARLRPRCRRLRINRRICMRLRRKDTPRAVRSDETAEVESAEAAGALAGPFDVERRRPGRDLHRPRQPARPAAPTDSTCDCRSTSRAVR